METTSPTTDVLAYFRHDSPEPRGTCRWTPDVHRRRRWVGASLGEGSWRERRSKASPVGVSSRPDPRLSTPTPRTVPRSHRLPKYTRTHSSPRLPSPSLGPGSSLGPFTGPSIQGLRRKGGRSVGKRSLRVRTTPSVDTGPVTPFTRDPLDSGLRDPKANWTDPVGTLRLGPRQIGPACEGLVYPRTVSVVGP